MSKKEQLKIVYEYLTHLDDVLKEYVRRQEVQVASFSFSRLSQQVMEIDAINDDNSLTAEQKTTRINNYEFKNPNALNVYNSASSISSRVKKYVEDNRTSFFSPSMFEPSAPRKNQDPCAYPDYINQLYPIIKAEAYPKPDAYFPIKWEAFILNYLYDPIPYYKVLQNPFEGGTLDKLKLTIGEYAEQKDFFDKIKQPDKYTVQTTSAILDWYNHNKGTWFASGDQTFAKENTADMKKRLLDTDKVIEKYRRLYTLVYDKICLNALFRKAMECTLPPLECSSLIRLMGVGGVLTTLQMLKQFDPRVSSLEEKFNSRPETDRTEENFFLDTQEIFEEDLEYICQFIIFVLFKSFNIKSPSWFDLVPSPKTMTDPFQGFLEELTNTLVNIVVDFSISLIIDLIELLEDCDSIEKLLTEGDLSGTPFENLGQDATNLVVSSFKELGQDAGSFLLGMKNKVNQTQLGKSAAITSGNRTFGWSAMGNLSLPTLNQEGSGTSSGVNSLFGNDNSQDSAQQDPRFTQIASIISADEFFNELVTLIGMSKTLRLLSGQANDSTMELVYTSFFSELENVSTDYLLEIFSIIGIFYGLNNLKDEFLGAATGLEDLGIPSIPNLKCNVKLEDMDPDKLAKVQSILNKITNSDFLSDLSDPDGNPVTSAFDSVAVPRVVEDSIRTAVKGSIMPIKMSYDNDMRLYKAASSEEILATRKVPKILWAGRTIRNDVFEDGKVVSRSGKLQDTIINPEFEGMVNNGYIPTKTDGKIDGSKFGALLAINWWPPFTEKWLTKTRRITLGREGEDGDAINEDAHVADLPGALGPYTDYDVDTGGSAYAFKKERQVRQASGTRKSLGLVPVDMSNSFIGDELDLDNPETLNETLFEKYFKGRGERKVYSEETIEELDRLYGELEATNRKIELLQSFDNPHSRPPPAPRAEYPDPMDDRFFDKPYDPGSLTPMMTWYKWIQPVDHSTQDIENKRKWIVNQTLESPWETMRMNYILHVLLHSPQTIYTVFRNQYPDSTLSNQGIRDRIRWGTNRTGDEFKKLYPSHIGYQTTKYQHLYKWIKTSPIAPNWTQAIQFTNPDGSIDYYRLSDFGVQTDGQWILVFNQEKYNAEKAIIDEQHQAELLEYNGVLEEYNENVTGYLQELFQTKDDLRDAIDGIREQEGELDIFENYSDKAYYGFSGTTNKSVISEDQNVQKFMGDDNRIVEIVPSYRISMASEYGYNLDNDTYFFIYRDGRKPARSSIKRKNSFSLQKINDLTPTVGPYDGMEETPLGADGQPCESDHSSPFFLEDLTSQERVFHHVMSEFFQGALAQGVDLAETINLVRYQGNDYDNIYKNIFQIFLSKMRNSELLKEVDVLSLFKESFSEGEASDQSLSTYNGEAPIGMSFINFNPTESKNYQLISKDPRIMDFDNLAEQIVSNYNLFKLKDIGEENPDGLQNYETSLQLALRTAHPVLVARIYLLEYMLQSIVPTMAMGFVLNELTQKTILSRIQLDMSERTPYLKNFKENTIKCFKLLRDNELINTDVSGEPLFSQAFGFFLKREAPFILGNLRKVVFKEQISCAPDPTAGLGLSENGDNDSNTAKTKMKETFLDAIPMTEFERDNFKTFNPPTFPLIGPAGRFFDPKSSNDTLYKNMDNLLEGSEEGTLLLQINSDPYEYFGANSWIAAFLNGNDQLLRQQFERFRNMINDIPPEHLNAYADFPYDNFEEWVDDTFASTSVHLRLLYVKKGDPVDPYNPPDENQFPHPIKNEGGTVERFFYFIDKEDGSITKHRCYELAKAQGTYQQILGQSLTEFARICEEQLEEQYNVTGNGAYEILENAVVRKLLTEMRDSDKFDVMFDYCFNIGDISSIAAAHISQSNMTDDMLRMFNSTKEKIRLYLNNLDIFGTDTTKDNSDCLAKAANTPGIGNFNADMDFSSEILLLMLSTPLYIYKGWVKVADPHCLITQTIVDLAETGFLIPKMKEYKIPRLDIPPPDNCTTISLPTFPGQPISFFGLTQAVALGVTFAPCIVGAPPFPPTPFGLVYYAVVEPLLYLLEMDWRNEMMMENPDYKNAIVVQTGLPMEDVPVCIEDQELLSASQEEEAQAIEEASENLDEDSSCPTLDIEIYKGDNC